MGSQSPQGVHHDRHPLRSTATRRALERWRVIGTGPKYIRLPGKVIYRLCDIEAYENECLVSSTAEFRKAAKPVDQAVDDRKG